MSRLRNRHADTGMAVVAVMVLIALLFLTGTVMALAVSSSLRTIDATSRQDAIHYAAESAVAQGVAAASSAGKTACPLTGSINHQDFVATCTEPLQGVAPDFIQLFSFAGKRIEAPDAVAFQLPLPERWKAVWTVVAWRTASASPAVIAWIDKDQDCGPGLSSPSTSPVYVMCQRSGNADNGNGDNGNGEQRGKADSTAVLHISVRGGSVALGSFVVRAAVNGTGAIGTVVGTSGFEVDEADVALPGRTVRLWNTVLP